MERLGIDPVSLLSQIINILILFIALYFLLWKRVVRLFAERRQKIAQGIEDAEQARRERERAAQEYERRIEEAKQEREKIIAQAAEEGDKAKEAIIAEARAEAEAIIADGRAAVERDRQQMLAEMRSQVAMLAIAVSNRIIGETLDEQRQRRLIDEFFSGIRAGRVVVLEEEELEWAKRAGTMKAQVTSALPLTEEEQRIVAESLTVQLGEPPELEFSVNPAILGGLVLKIGDRLIDGSVAGRLASLQERLR